MKFIIQLHRDYFNNDNIKGYYDRYFKRDGWLYSEDYEAIYYEADIPFMPIEGQRLGTKLGASIVKYAIYELYVAPNAPFMDRSIIFIDEE